MLTLFKKEISAEDFDEIPILTEDEMCNLLNMFNKDHEGTFKKLNGTSVRHMMASHEKLRAMLRNMGVEVKSHDLY